MIPFNQPRVVGTELDYIRDVLERGHFSGDGPFTKRCHAILEQLTSSPQALLTHSCTAALEMAAILANVEPGDEVIMPSFTFVSTANAFVLRGAVPVFVDIRPDTLNIDETLIESAITSRTKAIVVVHYAGVACEMDAIRAIADEHGLLLIEDAAQAMGSWYGEKALGALGHLGALSFHETKNIIAGEGGALLVNDARFQERGEIIREKGTNRSAFFRGQVDKYTWVDVGSSYLPGETVAAFLCAQLEHATELTAQRIAIWNRYHAGLAELENEGWIRRPNVPVHCRHNAHLYYLLLPNLAVRQQFINELKARGIGSAFHYVPLHSAPAGRRLARVSGELPVTDLTGDRLVRLPLWVGLESRQAEVIDAVRDVVHSLIGKTRGREGAA